ncbi:hypothetical protein SASPL_109963 [Salvia splendens]|uniref:Uncharacterized protein n=1 Tax=Salvia splendens TaxID=180675 RepID=A0A8X9A3S2_SALSN|nr:hypothetical protein SASPL_109963 [Salvia splendens]
MRQIGEWFMSRGNEVLIMRFNCLFNSALLVEDVTLNLQTQEPIDVAGDFFNEDEINNFRLNQQLQQPPQHVQTDDFLNEDGINNLGLINNYNNLHNMFKLVVESPQNDVERSIAAPKDSLNDSPTVIDLLHQLVVSVDMIKDLLEKKLDQL